MDAGSPLQNRRLSISNGRNILLLSTVTGKFRRETNAPMNSVTAIGQIQVNDAVPTKTTCGAALGSGFVDFFAVSDLDDENDVWGLDGKDNAPIFHTQPPCTPEAVPQGLAKLDGVSGEFALNGLADAGCDVLGQFWDIFVNDAFQIFDSIAQAQTFW
jgi:hypothetical protein